MSGSGERDESTKLLEADVREYVVQRFRVEVKEGPDAGRSATAARDELLVGTAQGNDLILTDPAVSRQHLSITALPRGFLVTDLGSSNGTTLGSVRIERAFLKPGGTLGVGISTLRLEVEAEPIREPLSPVSQYGTLLGQSKAMRRIFGIVPRLAASDSTVLIEGETGTGKSLLAEAIHSESKRQGRPFVVVDCGAIAPSLVESELFGHERGAFTGAVSTRVGAFEAAAGGTVLLDEIGELPLDLQPKLLRALEAREIKRVGGTQPIRLDVRILAATNRDLKREVNRGTFRGDLFYRLNVVSLRIPPLRERPEDVPVYVGHFFQQMAGPQDPPLAEEVVKSFSRRTWPGNVRELRGAVERAILLGDLAEGEDLATTAERGVHPSLAVAEQDFTTSFRAAKERAMGAWERAYLAELCRKNQGNLSRAARAARMDRNHLRELLKRYGLSAEGE